MTLAPPEAALDPAWLAGSPLLARLSARLAPGRTVAAGNLWGSSQALLVAALARAPEPGRGGLLVLCSTTAEAEAFALDLLACGVDALALPAREASAFRRGPAEPESLRARLLAAQVLAGPRERRPALVLAPLLSLLQPLPAPSELERKLFHLQVGAHLDVAALIERLVAAGYARAPLAERPGELSQRGDILDVFPFASELPLRVELFDQDVKSTAKA